tara:strand:+ start:945 stop:1997 length:1053 start_codon:yes stop_codon:yes gene_type:complete
VTFKRPFFSIGIPTYNRVSFLKQTVGNLINENFKDFEILIGNDYQKKSLSKEIAALNDKRIKIINHSKNLGELENMNYLLNHAKGRYFTWIFDDDPPSPLFLKTSFDSLEKYNFPTCVYSSYKIFYNSSSFNYSNLKPTKALLYTGKDFLNKYLTGQISALGCCGFYKTDYLLKIGGAFSLSNNKIAIHSEYLLLIKTGLLKNVLYLENELVSTRIHSESWTMANNDYKLFKNAGLNLLIESIKVLKNNDLEENFPINFSRILKFVVSSIIVKLYSSKNFNKANEIKLLFDSLEKEIKVLKNPNNYNSALKSLIKEKNNIPIYRLKSYLKRFLPISMLNFVHTMLSLKKF